MATANSIRVLAVFLSISLPLLVSRTSAHATTSHGIDVTLPKHIPEALVPPGFVQPLDAYMGMGYQEYTYNGTQWMHTNVSADLFDKNGTIIGHHQFVTLFPFFKVPAQPNWISYHNFSSTTGQKIAVVPQDTAVPLVLYKSVVATGDSMYFGQVKYVQMLKTSEGLPPDSSFKATTGQVFKSKFSALYAFYGALYIL